MCEKLTAVLTCKYLGRYCFGSRSSAGFLPHRVYRIGVVDFGVHSNAPNIRHLGSKPQGTLRSSCDRDRSYPSKGVGSSISLSHFSLYRCWALFPQRWSCDPSSVCAPELPALGFSVNYLTNFWIIGTDVPDGGVGCHFSRASSIIFLAYISLLICETSGSS